MTVFGRFFRALATLLAGAALASGAYWALLNVPESNVLALLLSALLLLLLAGLAGATLIAAATLWSGASFAVALRRAAVALPLFLFALLVFAVLWAITGWFDGWWLRHRGEADAVALRYLGFTGTAPIHTGIAWLSWLIRWAAGLSIVVAAATVAATRGGAARAARLAITLVPLSTITVGILLVAEGLWRLALWRPATLPQTAAELYFSGAKLAVLVLITAAIASAVLGIYHRAVTRA